jgi:hypothetical protein
MGSVIFLDGSELSFVLFYCFYVLELAFIFLYVNVGNTCCCKTGTME